MQAINQIGDENCYEDSFHTFDILDRDIDSSNNLAINHVGDECRDGGHVLAIEELVELFHLFLCNRYVWIGRAVARIDIGTPLKEKFVEDKSWVYGSEQEIDQEEEFSAILFVQILVGELRCHSCSWLAKKFKSLTITGNGMIGDISSVEMSSNVVKLHGFDKEFWG